MIYHTESRLNLQDITARSNTKDEEIMVCFTAQFEWTEAILQSL